MTSNWKKKFAWLPIKDVDNNWVWLSTIYSNEERDHELHAWARRLEYPIRYRPKVFKKEAFAEYLLKGEDSI